MWTGDCTPIRVERLVDRAGLKGEGTMNVVGFQGGAICRDV